MLAPRDEADLADCIASHAGALEPLGGGSKRAIGRPVEATPLVLASLSGVVDYRPEELVLTVRAATPLEDVQALLASRGQRLAFEPPDLAPLLGEPRSALPGVAGRQTIGGVIAANLSGSRRVAAGAARDHFLGFRAVSGRGERFAAGGKVVKNVTGYDLPKLLAGSWGTLAVLSEITLRAVPAAEEERTLLLAAGDAASAVALMSRALGSPHEVSAAAWEPERGVTLRIEGFGASVAARVGALLEDLAGNPGAAAQLGSEASRAHWRRIGGAEPLAECPVVWRLSVPPTDAPRVLGELSPHRCLLDWGGGLLWLGCGQLQAARVRGALRTGHATLVKGSVADRRHTAVFQPQLPALAALNARLKAAFDPQGRLNPGRMDQGPS